MTFARDFRFVMKGAPTDNGATFDMFEGNFTHEGEDCTFETLIKRFCVEDSALKEIAQIIHDIDLKDNNSAARKHRALVP